MAVVETACTVLEVYQAEFQKNIPTKRSGSGSLISLKEIQRTGFRPQLASATQDLSQLLIYDTTA